MLILILLNTLKLVFLFTITTTSSSSTTTLATASFSSSHFLKLPLLHNKPTSPSAVLSADKRRLIKLPLKSAASSGSGQYLVSLHLGTPPQPLLLVADTGSDLTWVSCSACRRQCRTPKVFHPRLSATFSPHHCYQPTCDLVPHPEKQAHCNRTRLHSTCRYEYSYSDGSVTSGFFSHETVTFSLNNNNNNNNNKNNSNILRLNFGCGFWNSGPPSFHGVLGLGRGPISFPSQLGRHVFSYCLLDYTLAPPPTSYLIIGGVRKFKMSYTPLLTNPLSPTFYYVGIESASINNVKLQISPSVWAVDEQGNGGTVVDSGTTLTFLPKPAYLKILSVLFKQQQVVPYLSNSPTLGFDLCLNKSSSLSNLDLDLPQLSFVFGGGSVFSPPADNYFIDTEEGVKCLALQPVTTEYGFSVIGNLMQQGYTFEFDKVRSRIGFSRHGCALS